MNKQFIMVIWILSFGLVIGICIGVIFGSVMWEIPLKRELEQKTQEYQWLKELADYWKSGGHFEKPSVVQEFQV